MPPTTPVDPSTVAAFALDDQTRNRPVGRARRTGPPERVFPEPRDIGIRRTSAQARTARLLEATPSVVPRRVARVATVASSSGVRASLSEDLLTSWASDPAGLADLDALCGSDDDWFPRVPAQWLGVPSTKGTTAAMPVLHPYLHSAFHYAVDSLREPIEHCLDSGVFGYRRGAEPGSRYARDWQRFRDWAGTAATHHRFVVHADVRDFFTNVSWARVVEASRTLGVDAASIGTLALQMERAGLDSLPPGYADARMLANLVLCDADEQVGAPLARWVDDYRVLVGDMKEANQVLVRLERALDQLGLSLNEAKTEIVPLAEEMDRAANTLASAYHPERDPPDVVRESLWNVFDEAVGDPIGRRRALRFSLARLGKERDARAVDKVLDGLPDWPWEAPRAVTYLAAVAGDSRIAPGVDHLLRRAVETGDSWLVARLCPLACRLGLTRATRRVLAQMIDAFVDTPAWGLALRVIALGGDVQTTNRLINDAGELDPRAALAAAADLGLKAPPRIIACEPILAQVLRDAPPALPVVDSIL